MNPESKPRYPMELFGGPHDGAVVDSYCETYDFVAEQPFTAVPPSKLAMPRIRVHRYRRTGPATMAYAGEFYR